jgi:cellulose synthase/poly-beta-1,6-N-acetylglucosamine synthase-like glycosyltransferase
MRVFALLALLLAGSFAAAIVATADGQFASAPSSAAPIAGAGPVLHLENGELIRGVTGRGRMALLAIPANARAAREIAAALTAAHVSATFSLDAVTIWQDRSIARDLLAVDQEIALAGLGPNDDSGLPEPAWRATETLALRSLEGASGRPVRIYAPQLLERGSVDAAGARLARWAIGLGLVPVVPSSPDASGRDALVVIRDASDVAPALAAARTAGAIVAPVGVLAGIIGSGSVDPLSTATTAILAAAARIVVSASDVVGVVSGIAVLLLLLRLVLIMAGLAIPRRATRSRAHAGKTAVLVPAHNEAKGIGPAIAALLRSDLPNMEIVVIDDGSTDATAIVARAAAGTDPRVRIVEQPNAGKAVALAHAFAMTDAPVVVVVDADSIVEPQALRRLVAPLADPTVGAVAGNVKVGNRRGLLGSLQHLEYVMGINLDRRFFERTNAITVVPGALGAFRSEAVSAAGGFPDETLAEDADLTFALGALGYRVVQVMDARVWTEAPRDWRGLYRQRFRWAYGMLQVLWKWRRLVVAPHATNVGRIGLPFVLLFGIALPLFAPAIDIGLIYGIVAKARNDLLFPFVLFSLVQLLSATLALRLDGESIAYAPLVFVYQLGYRQLMSFVVLRALMAAIAGAPVGWGRIRRHGLAPRRLSG